MTATHIPGSVSSSESGDNKKQVIATILRPLSAHGLRRVVPANTTLEFDLSSVWWIVKGACDFEFSGRPILSIEEGDVVGPWRSPGIPLTLSTTDERPCELIGFPLELVLANLSKDAKRSRLWAEYQSELCSQLFAAFVDLKASLVAPVPRHKRFNSGETIILEGDEGDEVFVLTKGGAHVLVQGAQVGKIHEDEVFGALAALTDSVRTATVVADQPSECMIFSRDEFRDLLRTNPNLLSKLFCDFGRALHDLNDTVLRANHTKWRNLF
jgi:hypothetical protein